MIPMSAIRTGCASWWTAQLRVADYYRVGIADAGIKPNYKVAASSYLKIASTYGHPGAQYSLGLMNIRGQGVKKNPQQGLKWLIAAARKRHALSEAYLGDLYWDGKLVQKDRTRAPDVVYPGPAIHQAIGISVDLRPLQRAQFGSQGR